MKRDRSIDRTNVDVETGEEHSGEMVGQGIGGVGGAVLGGAAGTVAGPVGTIIGGIAGAVGGWWAGRKAARIVEEWSEDDEAHYRRHHAALQGGKVPKYEDARIGYIIGAVAARNPGYADLMFEDIEADLRRGFVTEEYDWDYAYDDLRPHIREGYRHVRSP